MIKKIRNSHNGFTVIELLLYMAIFAIILTITVDLFFRSTSLQVEIVQNQEVDRNGRVALLEMIQTIHAAISVTSPALGASGSNLYLNNNAIGYFANGSGILQKTAGGQTNDLTSSAVTIQNLSFATRGEVNKQPTVSISFTARANTLVFGQSNYSSKTFQTTVQLR